MNKFSPKKLIGLMQEACQRRKNLLNHTNALRLVNGQGDGIPGIIIEQYNKHYAIQQNTALPEPVLKTIIHYIIDTFRPAYLIHKNRSTSPLTNKVIIAHEASHTAVTENGMLFSVELNNTLNCGLFLDMRRNRFLVGLRAKNKSVLNCFAHTCSFGVYCRFYGASSVINVDISKKSLDIGRKNYELNFLPINEHEFTRMNSQEYLRKAKNKKQAFRMIIIDPPTFSHYKNRLFSVNRDMPGLICSALMLLQSPGHLFLATNSSDISNQKLEAFLEDCLVSMKKDRSNLKIKQITALGQDEDFFGSGTMKESCLSALLVDFL